MKEFREYKEAKIKLHEENRQKEIALTENLVRLLKATTLNITNPEDPTSNWTLDETNVGYDLVKRAIQKRVTESPVYENTNDIPSFVDFRGNKEQGLDYLTEAENAEIDRWVKICEEEYNGNPMDEGFFSKLIGGVAGFLVGPAVGRVIARALGVEKGILYDMFTSRVVSAALGVAIAKQFGGEYKDKE